MDGSHPAAGGMGVQTPWEANRDILEGGGRSRSALTGRGAEAQDVGAQQLTEPCRCASPEH